MKKIFIIFFLGFFNVSYAQEIIKLTLRWNPQLCRYDVFAIPNFTGEKLIGTTLITIVVPAESPNDIFKITSTDVGIGIGLSQEVFISPISIPMVDFHILYSGAGPKVSFVQNQEVLLFGFTFIDNKCRIGVRLFDNEIDINLMPTGYDFRNSIISPYPTLQELYVTNYNNTGTICNDCKEKITVPYIVRKTKQLTN